MYKIYKKNVHWHDCLTRQCIMRLSLVALICSLCCLHISASTFGQTVQMRHAKISLKDAFKAIHKQTGYHYLWSAQKVKSNTLVSVDIKGQSLESAIESIIGDLNLSYELDGKLIIIKEKKDRSRNPIENLATRGGGIKEEQDLYKEVSGKVVDTAGVALQGVTVSVYTPDGRLLKKQLVEANGTYTVNDVPKGAHLSMSLLGYMPIRVDAKPQMGTQVLKLQQEEMEELVIVGYTAKKSSEVTGSVQSIKGDDLRSSVSSPNALSMLKGKTTGLYITEGSGEAGAKGQVTGRGQASMTTPTNNYLGPLIVVDGVITNFTSIQDAANPADIEQVSILKDAASTAIYGSRAAQGVIVITTKRGAAGKSTVDVRTQFGMIQPNRDIRFMNTQELIAFMDKQMVRYWEQTPSMQVTFPNVQDFVNERRVYTDEDRSRNYNWEDAMYSNGNFNNTELSLSHGTEKSRVYAGIGWYKENGVLYKNSFDRKSLRLNVDHAVSDKFKVALNISSLIDRGSKRNGIPEPYELPPFITPYDEQGRLLDSLGVGQSANYGPAYIGWKQNYLGEARYDNTNVTKVQNHLASARLSYDIIKGLRVQSTNSINYIGTGGNSYLDPRSFSGKYGGAPSLFVGASKIPNGTLVVNDVKYVDYLMSNTLNYNKVYGAHMVSALVGQEWGKRTTESSELQLYSLLPGERNVGAAQGVGGVFDMAFNMPYRPVGSYSERATFSVFGQVDYNFREKYLASASVRTDATTNFGRDKRYGTFYSFSGGWLLTAEDFMQDIEGLNSLKLRASYGTSGRDLGDGYLNTTLYSEGSRYEQTDGFGATITQLANPNISWETLYSTNVGMDVFLFERFGVNVDLYHKRSDGLLQNVTLPSAQGSLMQYQNVGQIVNKGLEVMVNAHIIRSKDFNWNANFNISFNKNSITKLYQDSIVDNQYRTYYRKIGEDINVIKAVKFAGINPENGNMQHYNFDAAGNEVIVDGLGNTADLRNWQTVGSATPKFFGGFSNTWQYKAFSLSTDWWFQYGNYTLMHIISNFQSPTVPRMGRNNIAFQDNQKLWEKPGDTDANYPDVFSTDPDAWASLTNRSSKMWANGSHLRLRNVRFSYNLPQEFLSKIKMSKASIHVSGDNLWVLKHKDFVGADPEGATLASFSYQGVGYGFANPRRFVVGIDFTF